MDDARSRGELKTNSFVRLRKLSVGEREVLVVNDLGDAETLLLDPRNLGDAARQILKRGGTPTEDGWGGWLGKYQAALCQRVHEIEEPLGGNRAKERNPVRSRGR
jgi:hypothetical protein